MNDVLLNDEDMSLMYLTEEATNVGQKRNPDHHQEIEMLFENYLLQAWERGGRGQMYNQTSTSHWLLLSNIKWRKLNDFWGVVFFLFNLS